MTVKQLIIFEHLPDQCDRKQIPAASAGGAV